MMGRPHPTFGWLWLDRAEWNATMQRVLDERDRLNDPQHVGQPPAFVTWAHQQLPRLASKYRQQFDQRIADLTLRLENLQRDIAGGRLDLQPEADHVSAEISKLSGLLA